MSLKYFWQWIDSKGEKFNDYWEHYKAVCTNIIQTLDNPFFFVTSRPNLREFFQVRGRLVQARIGYRAEDPGTGIFCKSIPNRRCKIIDWDWDINSCLLGSSETTEYVEVRYCPVDLNSSVISLAETQPTHLPALSYACGEPSTPNRGSKPELLDLMKQTYSQLEASPPS